MVPTEDTEVTEAEVTEVTEVTGHTRDIGPSKAGQNSAGVDKDGHRRGFETTS